MRNSKYNIILIFVTAFSFYLFFAGSLEITDPVESNYALTSKEMLLSGDWLSPQIYGQYWFDKPIFFYWVMAVSFQIFGISEFAARIGSALFAAWGVVLIYWFTAKIATVQKGLVAAAILATSLQYIVFAKLIHTDTALFFFANAALVFFYLGYTRYKQTRKWYILFYPCAALAVLIKGPVGILIPALIVFVFLLQQKNWREAKKMYLGRGVIIFAALALPWYALMYVKHGTAFIDTFFGIHNYLRATVSEHPRVNVFYYYPALLMAAMLPWSGIGLLSFYYGGLAAWRQKCVLSRFCLLWTLVYLVFYSLMATKYPTYVFPVLFPLTVLISQHIPLEALKKKTAAIGLFLPFILMLMIFILLLFRFLPEISPSSAEVVIVMLGLNAWCWLKRGDNVKLFISIAASAVIVFLLLSLTAFPNVAGQYSGKRLAAQIQPYCAENVGFYRQYNTSAVFYSGKILIKVVNSREANNYNPQAFNWSRKHTVPVRSLQEFIQTSDAKRNILLVEKSKWAQLMEEAQTVCWVKFVEEYPDFYIMEVVPTLQMTKR